MAALPAHVLFFDARSAQTEKQLVAKSKRQHRMVQILGWDDRTFYQPLHLKTGVYVSACVTHMNDWMSNRELG
jgi:hypothetical protein